MPRIHITGNAGSGKSTLAVRLGAALQVPVTGLDEIVWRPGWTKTPSDERLMLEQQLVSRPNWIIEGVSKTVREAAEIVILLDVSRFVAFSRCARRNWRYLFRSRPSLPPDCPELLIIPRLCRLIWNFQKNIKPQIVSDMQRSDTKFFHVSSADELDIVLRELGAISFLGAVVPGKSR